MSRRRLAGLGFGAHIGVALEGSWRLSRGGRREVEGPDTWAGGGTGGEGSLWRPRLTAEVSQ